MIGRKILKAIIFIIGFSLCSYPLISNLVVQRYQENTVATYQNMVKAIDKSSIQNEYVKAQEYNQQLYYSSGISISENYTKITDRKEYEELLNVSDNGIMGSVEIPKINVNLPIYHGTRDEVLNVGIGHVEESSLPIGGKNTRAVLTGHRGLPNSKLFTRLDELEIGDMFYIMVLDQKLAYKVCDIDVILPENVNKLAIQDDRDLVTLLTCTPYGINTHRLIVTGERIDFDIIEYTQSSTQMMSPRETIFSGVPFLFLGIAFIKIIKCIYKKQKNSRRNNETAI